MCVCVCVCVCVCICVYMYVDRVDVDICRVPVCDVFSCITSSSLLPAGTLLSFVYLVCKRPAASSSSDTPCSSARAHSSDFRGFRLVAMSILPIIPKKTIVYGSADGGHVVHYSLHAVNKRMRMAGKRLNLKEHRVGLKQLVSVYGPGDIEVHEGSDGKFYVLDFGRVFPPEGVCFFFFFCELYIV
jgi:Clustered mitochondria